MIPENNAICPSNSFKVAIDVDLTLLDTLTPWLDLYGLNVEDIVNDDPSIWNDLSLYLDKHGTPTPSNKYKKAYDYWCDPETYTNAKLTSGFMEFLTELKDYIKKSGMEPIFFIVSTCISTHKNSKVARIKELTGDFFSGFIDTSEKYLVDFDLLFDDSPHQCLQAASAGKNSFLVPAPMNNNIQVSLNWRKIKSDQKGLIFYSVEPYGKWFDQFAELNESEKTKTFMTLV